MSTSETPNTTISIDDAGAQTARDRAPAPPPAASAPAAPPVAAQKTRQLWSRDRLPVIFGRNKASGRVGRRGAALFDFLLRLFGIAAALTAAIVMGTTDETLPFFTQFFQFHANYADLPAMTFFVVANGIVAGYLALSLLFSIACIVRPLAIAPRLLLFLCDTVMLALLTAAASSATAIVYLAHNGDSEANWVAICLRFDGFCQRLSGSVVASFIGVVFFMVLVVMSALIMRRP